MSGLKDKVEGKIKNVTGSITGNEKQQAEGKAQETWGDVQNKAGNLKNDVQDKIDDMQSEREPVATGTHGTPDN